MESGKPRTRRQLSPEEKWEVFTGGHFAAAHAGRRSAEVERRREHGDPGQTARQGRCARGVRCVEAGADAVARAGGAGGRFGGKRSALGGAQGAGSGADLAPGKATLGLFGPVPRRVGAETKLELMGLVDGAVAAGWAHVRACRVLRRSRMCGCIAGGPVSPRPIVG
jgi:hypothetical protein